jgi:hypothetical protein
VDVERGEMVDTELDRLISRRASAAGRRGRRARSSSEGACWKRTVGVSLAGFTTGSI